MVLPAGVNTLLAIYCPWLRGDRRTAVNWSLIIPLMIIISGETPNSGEHPLRSALSAECPIVGVLYYNTYY